MGVFGKIKDSTKKGLVKGKEATVDKTRERREQKRQEEEEIAKIRLISITKKWSDEACNELGYQFVLNCDICNSEYKTRYVESSAATKGDRLKRIAHGTSAGLSIANKVNPANIIKRGDGEDKSGEKAGGFFNEWSNRYQKYGPAWQKDYAKAFAASQTEAKEYYQQCPKCRLWICPNCWDVSRKLCINDAKELALCHKCNKIAGPGNFCKECGAPQKLMCNNCQTPSEIGTKFCGNCGHSFNSQ